MAAWRQHIIKRSGIEERRRREINGVINGVWRDRTWRRQRAAYHIALRLSCAARSGNARASSMAQHQ